MILRNRTTLVQLCSDMVFDILKSEHFELYCSDEVSTTVFAPNARSYGIKWITGDTEWRLLLSCENTTLDIKVGTYNNLNDTGESALEVGNQEKEILKYVGQMGDNEKPFFYKEETEIDTPPSVDNGNITDGEILPPQVTDVLYNGFFGISDHGLTFSVWVDGLANWAGYGFSWFGVQSLRNPTTKTPIIAIHGKSFQAESYVEYCVVRETDVLLPTFWIDATVSSDDSVALINTKTQVAVCQDTSYCVFFPLGFNTQRYFYPHELDMIGYTSAEILSAESQFSDDRFGEVCKYRALHANGKFNTGMRPVLFEE